MAGSSRLRIRPATQRDLDAVRACLSVAFAPYETSYTAEAFRDTVPGSEGLAQRLRTMTILVAEDSKGDIVGTIAHEVGSSGIGHLRGMAVVPAALGSGTADRLIEAAERALVSTCTRVTLDTTQPLERHALLRAAWIHRDRSRHRLLRHAAVRVRKAYDRLWSLGGRWPGHEAVVKVILTASWFPHPRPAPSGCRAHGKPAAPAPGLQAGARRTTHPQPGTPHRSALR